MDHLNPKVTCYWVGSCFQPNCCNPVEDDKDDRVASSKRDEVKEVAVEGKKTAKTAVVGELVARQRWARQLLLLGAWW